MAVILLILVNLNSDNQAVKAQDNIIGPVLFGRPVGGDIITFQDVGRDRTWQVNIPNSSFVPISWSSDGCKLLLTGSSWAIVSVPNGAMYEIPQLSLPDVTGKYDGSMIWSYDGKSLTWTIRFSDSDVRIYVVHLDTLEVASLFRLNEDGHALQWLSDTELLYSTQSDYFVWNAITKETRFHQARKQLPPNWYSELYLSEASLDGEQLARYYNQNALRSLISASQTLPPSEDISPEYITTLEAIPQIPGFDIYSYSDDSIRHVDAMGQFLQFLHWSPSGDRIAVTTDPRITTDDVNGIYVYELTIQELKQIHNFPAMFNSEYGGYEPIWSPDSNWLALNTPTGYVIYNVESQETVKLADEFDGFYMRLQWSPIMDYSQSDC